MTAEMMNRLSDVLADRVSDGRPERLVDCGCNAATIRVFHAYLSDQFPGYTLRHFHAPSRVTQAGLPTTRTDHHVITIAHAEILPYSVVLVDDFEGWSAQDVWEHLRQWDLAGTVRGQRIAVVSKSGASAL